MHKFEDIKTSLSGCITELILYTEGICDNIDRIYNGNQILKHSLKESEVVDIRQLGNGLNKNLVMIQRSKMKCAFFGKTSNGKSAVVNAMLGEEVLPSCCGRTTSCFITVEGCKEEDGYFINVDNRRLPVCDLEEIASEFDDNSYGIDCEIKLFWPIVKCELLQYDVQLLDSPGCDVSVNNDSWIDKYCRDADVFVYVVDSSSTICESERAFFKNVKSKIGNPNLFVLFNKWDICEQNNSKPRLEQIRNQHFETIKSFFKNDMSNSCNHDRKIFFVSATNSLKESSCEFNRFVQSLTSEMTQHAITTKFKQHSEKGKNAVETVLRLVEQIINLEKMNEFYHHQVTHKIDSIITETLENLKDSSLVTMKTKCRECSSSIADNIKSGRSSIEIISILIKMQFKALFNNLKNDVATILPRIREELQLSSTIATDDSLMDKYIPRSFDELMSQYKEELSKKEINSEIKEAFNELNNYMCPPDTSPRFTDTPFFDVPIIGFGLFAVRSIISLISNTVSDIVSSATTLLSGGDRKAELEKCLNDRIYNYLSETVVEIIKQSQSEIDDRICTMTNIFERDCNEMSDLIMYLRNTKCELERISDDLFLEQVKISSLDDYRIL